VDVPEPPWSKTRRRPAARTPLARDSIVDAALVVLDRDGLDGLTMRRVAQELDTGAGALYWHVANKEELLYLLIDRILSELELPEPDSARWEEQIKELGRTMRTILKQHQDVARVTLGRVPLGPSLISVVEWQLTLLRGAGVPDQVAALAGDLLALYVGAFVYEETLPRPSDADESSAHEMIRDYFASVPSDRFPHTVELAAELTRADRDERFEFGMEVIVRGLKGHIS
jgi:TetR/AcrR family transcriptional regulator, tetracycline repressor protein